MSGYERENRNVLRRCLKTASDGAAVTWAGRSFHTVLFRRSYMYGNANYRPQ